MQLQAGTETGKTPSSRAGIFGTLPGNKPECLSSYGRPELMSAMTARGSGEAPRPLSSLSSLLIFNALSAGKPSPP